MELTQDRFNEVRISVREAARAAFTALREAHPDDEFYYFVLWTTGTIHRPAPCACSQQGLTRVCAAYAADGDPVTPQTLRWSEADSPYDCFGDEYFTNVSELFDTLGDPYKRSSAECAQLLAALTGAMSDLNQEGFFGVGNNRVTVVINVTMPGEEKEEEMIARARTLNPPEALALLEHDMGN